MTNTIIDGYYIIHVGKYNFFIRKSFLLLLNLCFYMDYFHVPILKTEKKNYDWLLNISIILFNKSKTYNKLKNQLETEKLKRDNYVMEIYLEVLNHAAIPLILSVLWFGSIKCRISRS